MNKICSKCKITKELICFGKNRSKKDGLQVNCKICLNSYKRQYFLDPFRLLKRQNEQKNYYLTNKKKFREYQDNYRILRGKEYRSECARRQREKLGKKELKNRSLKCKYGIDLQRFDELRLQQDYKCKICGIHESLATKGVLCVDHSHKTLKIRGLLCSKCNKALGLSKDSLQLLQKTFDYLE